MRPLAVLLACVLSLTLGPAGHADQVLACFEGTDYGGWKTTGEAFGPGPAHGTLPDQMPVSGYVGHGLANSYYHGDGTVGTLTSPDFHINFKYLNFLIGGGNHPGKTCLNLMVDGKVVRTATGRDSEQLLWRTFDLADLDGKTAHIQIVDDETGGWGHILVDEIRLSDEKAEAGPAAREIAVEKRYLNLPVKKGAPKRRMRYALDGTTIREFEIELADGEPDFWVFDDVTRVQGEKTPNRGGRRPARLQGPGRRRAGRRDQGRRRPVQGETPAAVSFHVAPRLAERPERFGLFRRRISPVLPAQPLRLGLGQHALGPRRQRRPRPLAGAADRALPAPLRRLVLLRQRRGGQGQHVRLPEKATSRPLVAAYTTTGRGECIAFSNDRGRTWTDYEGDPVVKHVGRDPRLLWHEPTKHWVMAVYDEKDGKQLDRLSHLAGPEKVGIPEPHRRLLRVPRPVRAAGGGRRRGRSGCCTAADAKYVVGDFDGKTFTPDEKEKQQLWYGNFYAAQTYSNAPDGRRIQIGWGNGIAFPDMPFNQQMAFPCRLTLRKTADGLRMFAEPVQEIESLHAKKHAVADRTLKPGDNPLADVSGDLFDLRAEFEPGDAEAFGFTVRGVPVVYDVKKQEISCRNVTAPLKPEDGKVRLQLLVDRGSIEIFGDGGRVALSVGVIPADDNHSLEVFSRGGATRLRSLEAFEMKSAWEAP